MEDTNSYFPDFKVISDSIDSMDRCEKINSLERKIEELESTIEKMNEEDEISRIDAEIEDKYNELDYRIHDIDEEFEKFITKMDKQIELLEENYNSIQKEQLCSCKTQELLEEKINKLETELIYNQHITVCLFKEIYEKLFPSIVESLDSFEYDYDDGDVSFDTNIVHEANKIKKMINDDGIEDYVQCKCDEYIDERDKDKIKIKIDKCKTLKELTTLALKEGFKQKDIDNAIEKGNTGLTILKEKRNAHSNLYELIYKKYLEKPVDIRVLGLPVSMDLYGPIFKRNLKHLD